MSLYIQAPDIPPDAKNAISDPMPDFLDPDTIRREAERINADIADPIIEGAQNFARLNGTEIGESKDDQQIWLLAAKLSLFNAVYFTSRQEAQEYEDFASHYADRIDEAGYAIDNNGGVAPIANFALHKYVRIFGDKTDQSVLTAKTSTPKYAIQGYDQDTIAVKPDHFFTETPEDCLVAEERHDWHDLAHVLAAASSQGKFGVKYHEGLDRLPKYYRQLTEGAGASDGSGPAFSDGLIFSHLSLPVFESGIELSDSDAIQEFITAALHRYLKGESSLTHPATGNPIKAEGCINPSELAVALQNKRYERRAAEMEKFILVRGTPRGPRSKPKADPLLAMSRSQRLSHIANLSEPLYFESRNLLRHRAHEDALGRIAIEQLGMTAPGITEKTVDFYLMNDLNDRQEINLYKEVQKLIDGKE